MAFELSPKNQLIPLSVDDLSPRHPLHLLHEVYMRLAAQASGAQLPDLETVIAHCPPALPDFWMLLEPVAADPFIDYAVLKRGSKIPGSTTNVIAAGERFTESIEEGLADERLMELTSCIVLKTPRYSQATSARRAAVNIKVYRGAYPVWQVERGKTGVILAIAQPYAEI